jgi:3-dehydroquinate synthase
LGPLITSGLDKLLDSYSDHRKIILVDENTHECCLENLIHGFPALEKAEVVVLPAGEENKSLEVCFQVWSALLEYKIDRHDLLLVLGGGLVTDMGGFIATLYKRGMDFIFLPTSLMAMVDASMGGKNGVNLQEVKNSIGPSVRQKQFLLTPSFWKPYPRKKCSMASLK